MKFKLVEHFTIDEGWQMRDDIVLKGTLFQSTINNSNLKFISFDQIDEKVYKINEVDKGYIIFKKISPTMNAGFIHQNFLKTIDKYNPSNDCSFTAYIDQLGDFVIELDSVRSNKIFKYYANILKIIIEDFYISPED